MNGHRQMAHTCLFLGCLFLLMGCHTAPPVIVDTTTADAIIVDIADTAGTIEVQTVTVYETVTKLIHDMSPEDKAKVEAEFSALRKTIVYLRSLPARVIQENGAKARADAAEISRLRPFEPEVEKQKAAKWRAYMIIAFLVAGIGMFIGMKVLR